MKELQQYNKEYQRHVVDPSYVPQAVFNCDTALLVMDYYKEGIQTNQDWKYFEPAQAAKTLMEFTNGQASPALIYNSAVWTKHYFEDLVDLMQRGYECNPEIMLKLIKQYDKVMNLLNEERKKKDEMHSRVQRIRSKNFELRKRVKKLEAQLLEAGIHCQVMQDKLTATEAIRAITEDTGSLAASCDFGN
jgi:hypothetical protein